MMTSHIYSTVTHQQDEASSLIPIHQILPFLWSFVLNQQLHLVSLENREITCLTASINSVQFSEQFLGSQLRGGNIARSREIQASCGFTPHSNHEGLDAGQAVAGLRHHRVSGWQSRVCVFDVGSDSGPSIISVLLRRRSVSAVRVHDKLPSLFPSRYAAKWHGEQKVGHACIDPVQATTET